MTKLTLSEDRRLALKEQLQRHYQIAFDETLSDFRTEQLMDLCIRLIGPDIYNQAVQEVRAHLQSKLDDLDGEVYVDPES